MRIILGSASKWRKKILSDLDYKFEVIPADIDEKAIRHKDPRQLTLLLSAAKAKALIERLKGDYLLITADQVITWNGILREKPKDKKEARYFLKTAHEYPSVCFSAIAVYDSKKRILLADVDVSKIWFSKFPNKVIKEILALGDSLQCSGGFTVEHPLFDSYVKKIEGEMDGIQGLPVKLFKKLMEVTG